MRHHAKSRDNGSVIQQWPNHLREREAAIRNAGFGVILVSSETAARFEIEMGRCGVLLICYTIPPPVSGELAVSGCHCLSNSRCIVMTMIFAVSGQTFDNSNIPSRISHQVANNRRFIRATVNVPGRVR